jgi:HK97 family phage portal protein
VKVRDALKRPIQLYWVPHWLIQPVWPQDGSVYIRAYQYLRDSEVVQIAREDVIHFRDGIDPRNDRLGLAALKAQFREVATDNECGSYTAALLRNMGVPGLVVIPRDPRGKFTAETAHRIKERIRDTLTGEDRGDTAVFSDPIELTPLGLSPEAMQLGELPRRSEARICAAFGLSPMVLGLPDPGKTYSNLAEAKEAAWRHCLIPLQDLVAETLQRALLPEFSDPDRYTVEYDYSHVEALQEDLALKHTRVREDWKCGLVTQNEARDELGYEPDPDGDRWYPQTGGDASEEEPAEEGVPAEEDLEEEAEEGPAPSGRD